MVPRTFLTTFSIAEFGHGIFGFQSQKSVTPERLSELKEAYPIAAAVKSRSAHLPIVLRLVLERGRPEIYT